MKEMYELEQRFSHTGQKGVKALSDKELLKLKNTMMNAAGTLKKPETE